mgnify:CR=1 FL=1
MLPVTDEIIYSSDADAGATLPLTNINGQASRNPYAGEAMGTMSLSQSVVFSFFPQTAVPDVSPWLLFFDEETPAVYPVADENGNYPSLGVTGGWIKTDGFTGSIGDADPLSSDQPEPDLALYWHTMDGFSADTGLGDELGVDGDFIESQAFAYLAVRSYLKLPISFPETTGCIKPTTGGKIIKFK